jgi:hypothetical protein
MKEDEKRKKERLNLTKQILFSFRAKWRPSFLLADRQRARSPPLFKTGCLGCEKKLEGPTKRKVLDVAFLEL